MIRKYKKDELEEYGKRFRGHSISSGINEFDPIATGSYIANMASNAYDYIAGNGEYGITLPPPKNRESNEGFSQLMEADSSSDQVHHNHAHLYRNPTAISNGSRGVHGSFIGNTQTDVSYETKYQERSIVHSLKRKSYNFFWGFSIFQRKDVFDRQMLPLSRFSKYPGLVAFTNASDNDTVMNIFKPFQTEMNDLSDQIYTNVINFYLDDFLDNKTIQTLSKYNKCKLLSISVEIIPYTQVNTIINSYPLLLRAAEANAVPFEANQTFVKIKGHDETTGQHIAQEYWVHRDKYGIYCNDINTNSISPVPMDAQPSAITEDTASRRAYYIKKMDSNICTMSNSKPFSFTREIKNNGDIYLTPDDIITTAQRKKNIGDIINTIEATLVNNDGIVKNNNEYFNLLFCPVDPPIKVIGNCVVKCDSSGANAVTGHVPLVNISTRCYIKCSSKWLCEDYKNRTLGDSLPLNVLSDPFKSELIKSNVLSTRIKN